MVYKTLYIQTWQCPASVRGISQKNLISITLILKAGICWKYEWKKVLKAKLKKNVNLMETLMTYTIRKQQKEKKKHYAGNLRR